MVIIQDKIISRYVFSTQFKCNLNKCKGACCWEGDFGAPLEIKELNILMDVFEKIKHLLPEKNLKRIEEVGLYDYSEEEQEYGTALMEDESCVYMTMEDGVSACAFEKAHNLGLIDFYKPISCHLYPIRVEKNNKTGFEALNYDFWDICSSGCQLGEAEKIPLYLFVKNAIIRKYGKDFFEEMVAASNLF